MKIHLKLSFLFLLTASVAGAQGIYNNGGKIVIGSGAKVVVNGSSGNFRNETSGSNGEVLLSGTLVLKGNLTNNTVATEVFANPAAGSEVIFNGSAIQAIGGTSTATFQFDKLTLNNSNGLTMGSDVRINNLLNFQSGIITTDSNTLTIGLSGSITGDTSTRYVNGMLGRVINATGSEISFPIGKGGNYRPLSINFSSLTGTSTVLAEQLESLLPGTPPANVTFYADRYWVISQTGGSDFAFKLTLNGDGFVPSSTKKMIKGDGTTNTDYDVSYSSPYFTNASPFNSFSNFGVGEYCLPQNVSFEAIAAKTYGDAPFTVSGIGGASGNPVIFSSSDTTVASCKGTNGTTVRIKKAGNCTISAIQAGDTTYCQGRTDRVLLIHPKPITITADTAQKKIYSSSDPTPYTYTFSPSLEGVDVMSGLMARNTGEDANSYAFTMGTLDAGSNYTMTLSFTPVFTIKPKPLTPEVTANSKCYDGSDTATLITQTLTGVVGTDTVSLAVNKALFENATAASGKTVIASGLTLEGAGASNYILDTISAATIADIYSLPVPVVTGSASVCIGSTGNVYSTETGKTAYVWTVSAGGSITAGGGSANSSVTVTWNTIGAHSVRVNYTDANSCNANLATEKAVTVNALPVPALTGPETACKNIAGQLYSTVSGMSDYVWNVSAGGLITAGGTSSDSSVTVTWNSPGAESVSINYTSVAGCSAVDSTAKAVTVISSPVPTVSGPTSVCSRVTGSKYITQAGQSNYNWSVSAGGTVTAGGTSTDSTATVTWNDSGAQSVSVNYENSFGCEGASAGVRNVTVKPLPVPVINGESAVCESTAPVEYTTETGKSAYTWALSSGGTITDGIGTNSITITWADNGFHDLSVTYTDTNGCSADSATVLNVGVGPLPVVGILGPDTACVTHPGKVYSTESGKTDYVWSVSTGGTITSGGTSSDNTVTVTWDTIGARTVSVNYNNTYGCSALNPSVINVTALAPPVPAVSGQDTICSGETGIVYTTQSGQTNYVWTVSAGGTITSGGGTSDHTVTVSWDTAGDESVSVNYQNSNGCEGVAPGVQNVKVLPGSVGGSVSGSDIVCTGTNSTLLTLSDNSGNVVKWQKSTNNWTSSTDINDTTSTITVTNLTLTTKYRAIVQSGECAAANSIEATVSVNPEFTSGAILTTGETICYDGDPGTIGSITAAGGGDESIAYQWQSSSDVGFSSPADIISDAASYDPPSGLTVSTWYRRQAKDGTCNTTFSSSTGTWKVTIRPEFTSGAILTTGETICYDGDPGTIGSTTAAGGGDESISYQWQSSTDVGFSSPADISSDAASYTPPSGITESTWYRRQAKDGTCNTTYTSSTGVWKVTVEAIAESGSLTKTPDVTYICQGDDVSASLTAGSGGNGTDELEYRTKTGASWSGWTAYTTGTDISSTGKTGIEVQTRRMASYCSNSDYTTVSWIVDLTNPLAVAKVSGTVTLDPTGNYTLTTADVLSSYSDAGVGVETVSMVPASVSCANLGLLTITVTVTDYCGNQTIVTPQITVLQGTALLSPWVQGNTSPSANGTAVYSPCTNNGTFYLTTQGVSAPKVDVHDFVYQQLCGNGTVIVRLDDVQNGGWAGVMMRESNAPGAKAVYIKTRLYNPSVYIGYRTTTNGNMTNVSQSIPSIHWMKIQRSGNIFMIYTSYNGTSWIRRYTATVAMTNCINAGFFAENIVAGRTTKAWFDHAEVVGYLKTGEEVEAEKENSIKDAFEVSFYPNPANNQITIEAPENTETIKMMLISAEGVVVETKQFNSMEVIYNLQLIKPGIYLLRFERDGMVVNKRLIVM